MRELTIGPTGHWKTDHHICQGQNYRRYFAFMSTLEL